MEYVARCLFPLFSEQVDWRVKLTRIPYTRQSDLQSYFYIRSAYGIPDVAPVRY